MFRFLVEEKIKCLATEKVKYTQRVDYIMQLPVPMDAALNKGRWLSARPGCGWSLRVVRSTWAPYRSRAHGVPCSSSRCSKLDHQGKVDLTLPSACQLVGCVEKEK